MLYSSKQKSNYWFKIQINSQEKKISKEAVFVDLRQISIQRNVSPRPTTNLLSFESRQMSLNNQKLLQDVKQNKLNPPRILCHCIKQWEDAIYCVVNFYHLVEVENPEQMTKIHKKELKKIDIRGRIYITKQGINAQFSGLKSEAFQYMQWVQGMQEFEGLQWSVFPVDQQQFPTLRIKTKQNLISLEGGMQRLNVTEEKNRATKLSPQEWKQMLEKSFQQNMSQGYKQAQLPIVIDLRNDYEWDAGHFEGALRPSEEMFKETPVDKQIQIQQQEEEMHKLQELQKQQSKVKVQIQQWQQFRNQRLKFEQKQLFEKGKINILNQQPLYEQNSQQQQQQINIDKHDYQQQLQGQQQQQKQKQQGEQYNIQQQRQPTQDDQQRKQQEFMESQYNEALLKGKSSIDLAISNIKVEQNRYSKDNRLEESLQQNLDLQSNASLDNHKQLQEVIQQIQHRKVQNSDIENLQSPQIKLDDLDFNRNINMSNLSEGIQQASVYSQDNNQSHDQFENSNQTQQSILKPLEDKDKNVPVLMYCTGGIRCDIYSTVLKQKGYNNLYTLEGGVQNYLAQQSNEHWKGSLFVFDGRMAIPSSLDQNDKNLQAAVPCYQCSRPGLLPHMNCANIDCNKLFIACNDCKQKFRGCCCQKCIGAPRLLRPAKIEGSYGQFGNYAQDIMDDKIQKFELELNEKKKFKSYQRRQKLKNKIRMYQHNVKQEKQEQKQMMRKAMQERQEVMDQQTQNSKSKQQQQQGGIDTIHKSSFKMFNKLALNSLET